MHEKDCLSIVEHSQIRDIFVILFLHMDSFSQLIITSIQGVPQAFQIFVIFLFSYAEGLPIIGSILPGGTIALLAGSLSATGIFTPINAVFTLLLGAF